VPYRDLIGRKQPHRLTVTDFIRAMPHLAHYFPKVVPPEAIKRGPDGVETVACTCGSSTPVAFDGLSDCSGGCGRTFWNASGKVRVAYDPEHSSDASRTLGASETPT
jgi:hypothetical protein